MESKTPKRIPRTRKTRTISPLEKLPCELRQQIYFYLGFPVAGRCLHTCDDSCVKMTYRNIGFKDQRGKMRITKCLSKTKAAPPKSGDAEEHMLKLSPTCFHQLKPLRGVETTKNDEQVHHLFDSLAGIGLMGTSRFFYHDTAACLYKKSIACSCPLDEKRIKIRQPVKRQWRRMVRSGR